MTIIQNQNDDYRVRGNVAKALGTLGNISEEVEQELLTIIQNQNHHSWVRYNAAEALNKLGKNLEEVKKSLQSLTTDNYVGHEAAELLKKLRNDS